ncbi:MAG: SET domain-containing protein-lysine N-methyltransferase [Chitinophagaceae bacterium]|nr:SET domain-containing protein-lysine N-methyltransferase [Chitinophagaceae bacterium]
MVNEDDLEVKQSGIPNAGNGLFTRIFIPAGTNIVEYTGVITTWNEAKKEWDNGYIYYISRNRVIDAKPHVHALARYANDAAGLEKVKRLKNNCVYKPRGKRIFIHTVRDIQPGEEILVEYGKEYWDTIRENIRIENMRG